MLQIVETLILTGICFRIFAIQKYSQRKVLFELYKENENFENQQESERILEVLSLICYVLAMLAQFAVLQLGTITVMKKKKKENLEFTAKFQKMVQLNDTLFSFEPNDEMKVEAGLFISKLDDKSGGLCQICYTESSRIVIYKNCNHGGLCLACFAKVKKKKNCPFCRKVSSD